MKDSKTVELSTLKERILDLIPKHQSAAVNLAKLIAQTGLSAREIKLIITMLRCEYPICAKETDGGGYWIAESDNDIAEFISMIERRKQGYENTITTMREHLSGRK